MKLYLIKIQLAAVKLHAGLGDHLRRAAEELKAPVEPPETGPQARRTNYELP